MNSNANAQPANPHDIRSSSRNSRKDKVLFLSHVPILPKIGGDRVRIWQSLSLLLDEYDVDVIYTVHHNDDVDLKAADSRIGRVWRITVPKWKRAIQCAASLINRLPFAVNLFHNRKMQRIIDKESSHYDFIFCASPVTARYIRPNFNGTRFLDMTDSLTLNYDNKLKHLKGIAKRVWALNACRMRRYELLCVESFTATAYIANRDRDYVAGKHPHTFIVPNLVEIPATRRNVTEPLTDDGSPILLFVGKMDYEPNIRAAVFFANEVFRGVRRQFPGARFIIAGMSPAPDVIALAHITGVEITGFVESMDPYYESASLFVAPMLSGSGVQNKILEAMARECCVLTTPIGAEGLEKVSDGFVVCDADADTMAHKVCNLLSDINMRKQIGTTAAKLIQEQFGRPTVKSQFYDFVNLRS